MVFIVISYSCFHLYRCQNPIFTYVYSELIKTFELNRIHIIRPYGFVRIFFILFLFIFFLLPPPRFPDDNFCPPSRTAPEFKPVTCHGHRKKCIIFRPRATPGWGRGAPQTPQNPPPPKFFFFLHAFQNPRNIFEKQI